MDGRNRINVLFVCNDNSVRSLMAESLLQRLGGMRFRAFSAGSTGVDDEEPDRRTFRALSEAGLPVAGLRRKRWAEFTRPGSPHMDLVVTLCDATAGEPMPDLPGEPGTAHWSHPNPLHANPDDEAAAFRHVLHEIRRHVELLVNLPDERVDRLVLEAQARELAQQGR
ncbi:arsenate reductase ArsC [Variovorax rhizosphaerae]|uniref:Arsenate reductase ArsC n=1 Tax=Variovorax rhizosphaerae TaxID=1836200 RepID=A0ABU8WL65_9BURK